MAVKISYDYTIKFLGSEALMVDIQTPNPVSRGESILFEGLTYIIFDILHYKDRSILYLKEK